MKKKILLVVASLALVTTLAVNGTFAQELHDAFNNIVDTLVGFVGDTVTANEAELKVELVFSARCNTPTILAPSHYTDDNVWNKFVIVDGRKVWDSTKITGAVDKFVAVKNESPEKKVYFRLAIAVRDDDVARRVLRVNLDTAPVGYKYDGPHNIEIKDVPYTMHVFTYTELLEPNDETAAITMQAALSKETNNQDMHNLGTDFLQVKVVAIEANAFVDDENKPMSAVDALEQAVPLANFNPFE